MLQTRKARAGEHLFVVDVACSDRAKRQAALSLIRRQLGVDGFEAEYVFDMPKLKPARISPKKLQRAETGDVHPADIELHSHHLRIGLGQEDVELGRVAVGETLKFAGVIVDEQFD